MLGRATACTKAALLLLAIILLTQPALAECRFPSTTAPTTITYRVFPETTPAGHQLRITMSFRVPASTPTIVNIPSDLITGLHLLTPTATLTHDSSGTTVTAPRSTLVTISYLLHNGWSGPLVNPHQFQPIIQPQYTELTGDKALVWLARDADANANVIANFDWQSLPPAWSLATSFGVAQPLATQTRCQTYRGPWTGVNQALFAAGDFRLHPFRIGRRPGVLAVRGTWTFSDDQAADDIAHTIQLVRAFWHDDAFPFFLVTLQPFDRDHGSSDGSAYTNAFWMFVSRQDNIHTLLTQLAHESFHAWNPLKMGPLSMPEFERTKWFKEGATEYYAQKLTYAGGELSAPQLIASLNKDLLAFPTSTSEYIRGRILSLWLDAAIRARSHGRSSLDDVMFRLVRDRVQPLTEARLLRTIQPFLSAADLALLQQAADHHGDLPAPATVPGLGPCVHAVLADLPTYAPGFDFNTSRSTRTISGVDPTSPAYQAGLRNGQPLLSWDIDRGDPNRQARITVGPADHLQTISFLPAGPPAPAWQYLPGPPTACTPPSGQLN